MLRSKPLPPIQPPTTRKPSVKCVSFPDWDPKSSRLDDEQGRGQALAVTCQSGTRHKMDNPRPPMNRPVFLKQRSPLVTTKSRPEDGVAALSAALSARYPLVRGSSTNDFKRSRTLYTTNATLVNRKKPSDSREGRPDNHKRQSYRRRKDPPVLLTRGSHHSFPPGKVIKRNDDNIVIPQMFPKVRRVDRGGPCPTQLYTQTKLSYSGKINGSVQLDHYVQRNSRPRIEPLQAPSTSAGASGGEDSLESVISSSRIMLEDRGPDRLDREWPGRGLSPLFRPYHYFDDEPSVPPNSEIGPSRMQMMTPNEH
ncbi:uncharacterized protein LOC110973088 [Acanthaster planci]|uniref:Uncharacterized protein LOC110973088 n=1 Tax=Acanthaster planci TaxID=133434 RepID=A0A8B7XEU1_ACAPL|nr:uncharacterized protein LOC110973088 [Acanthaster planci]XP_022079261.1 uncharacterized protein LOC110973088 [Acanthaster planci]XP_022079263.1 uncharacterized protein LOC110973088 [Acanthaster planci]